MCPTPRAPFRRARRVFGHAGAWWALGAVGAAWVWRGCTVTPENYSTLSFFFDGVPDPAAARPGGKPGDTTLATAVVVHPPFAQENCEVCHKTQYRPNRNDPSACLTCHQTVKDRHPWTHGAVAGGACLWCHAPHESARTWLLRAPDRTLCAQCHSASMTAASPVPAHADPEAGCLSCHFGHGGENSFMLRPGATALSPPPTPASPPALNAPAPDPRQHTP